MDIDGISKKMLVISLFMNVLFLVAYTVVVLYIESKGGPKIVGQGALAENLVYFFPVISVIEIIVAFYLRKRDFSRPMIKSEETFARDFDAAVSVASIRLFALAETIAIFGLVMYFLAGEIMQYFIYLAVSILFFLVIRPTKGLMTESLERQAALVSRGEFAKGESR